MASSVAVGLGGILLAAWIYLWNPSWAAAIANAFRPLYQISVNKFWFDEIYAVLIVRPFQSLARILFRFDLSVIDGLVNWTGIGTLKGSDIHNWVDKYIVDGFVNFVGYTTQFFSAVIRRIQTGFVQNYLLIIFLGVLVLMWFELR
jgi:NADH:ubiquinone oxidoreductase subunit 5 (subunit L)/multisubunit Na+/H+ antiporter MnhA subunit